VDYPNLPEKGGELVIRVTGKVPFGSLLGEPFLRLRPAHHLAAMCGPANDQEHLCPKPLLYGQHSYVLHGNLLAQTALVERCSLAKETWVAAARNANARGLAVICSRKAIPQA
jgi:hypothetical protein